MCGIFSLINNTFENSNIQAAFNKGQSRGPEYSNLCFGKVDASVAFGFHRLAINGLDEISHQPLIFESCSLICNGEIYNYKQLIEDNNISTSSNSDCEIILYLYEKYGIEKLLNMIDSESFAFCIYDGIKNEIIVARDRFGVRPLFVSKTKNNEILFCSEAKSIIPLIESDDNIEQFKPGCWKSYSLNNYQDSEYQEYYSYHL